jgi:putative membrane protein
LAYSNCLMIGRRTHIVKSSVVGIYALCLSALISGCRNPNENSENIAKKENDRNFDSKVSEKEADFVVETIASNFANVKFAQMAVERSNSEQVKEIAAMIEKDHEGLIKELKGFANMRGIAIPLEENAHARKKLEDLSRTGDNAFDEKWCRELTNRHEKTIERLEDMWEHTKDEDLKKWINSALPGLRNNLVKLNSCHEKLTM